MTRLSAKTLEAAHPSVQRPAYDRDATGIGIVHFGPGAFTRAHQAVYTDDAMARSGGDWGICAVALNSARAKTALGPQDGLYTLAIRDLAPSFRLIGAIKEVLFAGEDKDAILDRLCAAQTRFVTLTITEKGYAVDASGRLDLSNPMIQSDLADPDAPVSAMGYIVLAARKRLSAGLDPLCVISCDNLPNNGDRLRAACADLAAEMDADTALYNHIRRVMRFPNTMVDAITPSTDDVVLDTVETALGLRDMAAVQREAFAQWVIEDNLPADRPDWAGAGAIITSNVHAFETTKLRILNGAHSALTYLGLLLGHATVGDAVADARLRKFVDVMIRTEAVPTLTAPDGLDLSDYWDATLARFDNPHIEHRLEQISHDGSQKIPARILPVIMHHGGTAAHATIVAAGWIVWTRDRRGTDRAPTDGFLSQLGDRLPDPDLDIAAYVDGMLALSAIFPTELSNTSKTAIRDAAIQINVQGLPAILDGLT